MHLIPKWHFGMITMWLARLRMITEVILGHWSLEVCIWRRLPPPLKWEKAQLSEETRDLLGFF